MHICSSIDSIRQQVSEWKSQQAIVAFVPTMGNLHAGHLELVKQARNSADHVVVSIFVNPLQFNETADFELYPRTLDDDVAQLQVAGVDALFTPEAGEIYPQGQSFATKVWVPGLGDILEGEHRPGHFTGVTTVVNKLFNLVQPDLAIFGEKDYQQLMLVRRMVSDLNMPVQIVSVATRREEDGLAMSSRNSRLSTQQRQQAPAIYHALNDIVNRIRQGESDFASLEQSAMAELTQQGFDAEYLAIRRTSDLAMPTDQDQSLVVLAAARLGNTRLIDNMTVKR